LALTLLIINLLGDLANALSETEPRAIVGIPVVAALLFYLGSRRVRLFFGSA
jgi:hypothetical protein